MKKAEINNNIFQGFFRQFLREENENINIFLSEIIIEKIKTKIQEEKIIKELINKQRIKEKNLKMKKKKKKQKI